MTVEEAIRAVKNDVPCTDREAIDVALYAMEQLRQRSNKRDKQHLSENLQDAKDIADSLWKIADFWDDEETGKQMDKVSDLLRNAIRILEE